MSSRACSRNCNIVGTTLVMATRSALIRSKNRSGWNFWFRTMVLPPYSGVIKSDDNTIHMVQGKNAHHGFALRHLMPLCDGGGIDEKIVVVEDHTLGIAGRSGRVDHQRFVREGR